MAIIKQVRARAYTIIRKQLQREFVRFCLVGVVGFVVNLTTLILLRDLWHLPIILAVLVGGEASLVSNFTFHNYWTYRERPQHKKIIVLFMQFHVAFWAGNGINAILTLFMITQLGWNETVALGTASVLVLFWNFAWTRYYIWRAKEVVEEEVS